jgi:hypothetical protein
MSSKGSARDHARRRAMQAKAARDQARKLREDQIGAVLADYYLAAGQAQRLREQARQKADAVLAGGEEAARVPDASAAQAVRTLRKLLGGVAEVAELCDLTQVAVRSLLATPKVAGAGTRTTSRPQAASLPAGAQGPGSRRNAGQHDHGTAEGSDHDGQ